MADISVAILGLGRVGTSIGMALKRYNRLGKAYNFDISGYDTVADQVKTAKKLEAIDHARHRPGEAVKDAGIVFITMPYGEIETVYELIGPALRTNAVVLDFSTLKQEAMRAAQRHMPEQTHLVCGAPIFNPAYLFDGIDETERATEDLFDKGMIMLMPSVRCAEEAITLANDVTGILGAIPHFFDPNEHDALINATEILPSVMTVAYFYTLSHNSGWPDTQRLTNPAFGMASHDLFDTHPDDLAKLWMDGGEQLIRNINELIKSLTHMRDLLQEKDQESISAILESRSSEYAAWINRRYNLTWGKERTAENLPTFSDAVGNMFGGFFKRRQDEEKK
ncbi:MAG: prephenate dehydrogenase/arogenate dehydrogenase family protein [Chloroflexota bacterium]